MREKRTFAQEYCVKSAGKAMQQLHMVQPGSRIGIAVSGGVDSFVLLKCLHIRQGIVPFPFEIMALLQEINNLGTTVLVVTHEKNLVELFAKRVIAIDDGYVVSDGREGYYGNEN